MTKLQRMQKLQSENDLFRQKLQDFARIAKDLKRDRDHYRSAYRTVGIDMVTFQRRRMTSNENDFTGRYHKRSLLLFI